MICLLIGHNTSSFASWITARSVTLRMLAEAEIKEDSECRSRIVTNNYKDSLSDDKSNHEDNAP